MVYMRNNHVRVNSRHPQAQAICDRCGFRYNRVNLTWQFEWVGPSQQNLRLLVCPTCIDIPNESLRVYNIGPDPLPIKDPRPDNVDDT